MNLCYSTTFAYSFISARHELDKFHCDTVIRDDRCSMHTITMRDRSTSDTFRVGDSVRVVKSVMKGGTDLINLTGVVCENWSKCEVDPTCCCAEQVDVNMAVLVEFDGSNNGGRFVPEGESFTHYFGEDELDFVKMEEVVPFDGMSCKAFKLDRLRMNKQSRNLEDDTRSIPP